MAYHELLGISRGAFESVRENLERRSYDGLSYRALPDSGSELERGTVLVDDPEAVVRGFPKIPRTLVLSEGIPRQFDGPVVVEEKLDGYNVRVARIDGRILAFTRGGIVCPFTTWKVREEVSPGPLFDEHPNLTVCGEMVGPENPYTVHDYPGVDSLAFRAFDLRNRRTGDSLAVDRRRALCQRHGIEGPELLGVFDPREAAAEVREIVEELDGAGREGVVMKSPEVDRQLKYTTSAANQGDLAFAFSLPFDYGQSFMFRRIIREAFQAVEFDGDDPELEDRARRLGEAILLPMVETVRAVEEGEVVGEDHAARGHPDAVTALLEHLESQQLELDVRRDERVDGHRLVEFRKVMRSTTDKTRAYLDGRIVRE